jgi:hypothetical protein
MRTFNRFKAFGFAFVSIITFLLIVSWGYPSLSIGSSFRSHTFHRTGAHELNLDYLNESRARPIADLAGSLIPQARSKVQSTSNVQVAIPIPSRVQSNSARYNIPSINSRTPVRASNGRVGNLGTRPGRYNVVGNRTPSGRIEAITPASLDSMFAVEERNGGFISPANRSQLSAQRGSHLVADASGRYAQSEDYFSFDLIAVDTETGGIVEIDGVEADSFCIDALHAVVLDDWRVNDLDVEAL